MTSLATTTEIPSTPRRSVAAAWGLALLVNVVLFALVLWLGHPMFETNDDPTFVNIVAGNATGQPSPYLIFINIIAGTLLQWLATHAPAVNWYGILLYALHFAAMTALAYGLLRARPAWERLLPFGWLFLGSETLLLINPQFTSTALLTGIGGIALWVAGSFAERRERLGCWLGAVILCVLAYLLRTNAFWQLALLAAPALCEIGWRTRDRAYLPLLGLLVLGLLGAHAANARAYSSPEWRDYFAYNETRARLTDYPGLRGKRDDGGWTIDNAPRTTEALHAVGWTANDARLFVNFKAPTNDPTFSAVRCRALAARVARPRSLTETLGYLAALANNADFLLASAVCLLLLGLVLRVLPAGQRWTLLATCGLVLVLFAALAASFKLPNRVILPPLALLGALAGLYGCASPTPLLPALLAGVPRTTRLLLAGAACIFLGLAGQTLIETGRTHVAQMAQLQAATSAMPLSADTLCIYMYDKLPINWISPFAAPRRYAPWPAFATGWSMESPLYTQTLARYRLTNIYRDLYQRPATYLLGDEQDLRMIRIYLREHFAVTVKGRQLAGYHYTNPYDFESLLYRVEKR